MQLSSDLPCGVRAVHQFIASGQSSRRAEGTPVKALALSVDLPSPLGRSKWPPRHLFFGTRIFFEES